MKHLKTHLNPPALAFCLCLTGTIPSVSGAPVQFDLDWSGASFGNTATATGQITIDDSLLANPGSISTATPGLITAFAITISGASAGDGTFDRGDFNLIFLETGPLALDFSRELVGQPTDQDPWGTSQPGFTGGDFGMQNASPTAPDWTFFFQLTTNGGAGDHMLLTSFRPTRPYPTIDTTDRFAWGENIGWTDWRYDTSAPGKGATIGDYFCAGLIWGENVGWIQLGTGAPADGIHYTNTDSADYGVNHDGLGNLSGLAWGENIGWVTFDQSVTDPPRVDLLTGKMSGYAYGENIGWIDLGSNGTAFVSTTTFDGGPDLDLDMIADPWELEQAAAAGLGPVLTHLDKTTDSDFDGASDFEEYLADSDPFDPDDRLIILSGVRNPALETIDLEWTSSPRRLYDLFSSPDLGSFSLEAGDIVPDPGSSTTRAASFPGSEVRRFWKVGVRRPLAP